MEPFGVLRRFEWLKATTFRQGDEDLVIVKFEAVHLEIVSGIPWFFAAVVVPAARYGPTTVQTYSRAN